MSDKFCLFLVFACQGASRTWQVNCALVSEVGQSIMFDMLLRVVCLEQEPLKKAKVGPLPGVTQDLSGFKVQIVSLCCY
jgi:hypothetical protein